MVTVTLEQVNKNILDLKKELDEMKEILEESQLPLTQKVQQQLALSRKRHFSQFKTQTEIEKKFL
ncbi:MAG: hypothetical protein AABX86_02365 [Nanoarchaeota archaeon]